MPGSYVGRVGGLAVALGIGLISGAGVAWAGPDDDATSTNRDPAARQAPDDAAQRSRGVRTTTSRNTLPGRSNDRPRTVAPDVAAVRLGSVLGDPAPVSIELPRPASAARTVSAPPATTSLPAPIVAPEATVMAAASIPSASAAMSVPLSGYGPFVPAGTPLAWAGLAVARGQTLRTRGFNRPIGGFTTGMMTDGTDAGVPTAPVSVAATAPAAPAAPAIDPGSYAPGEVLIGWAPGASAFGRATALAAISANVLDRIGTQAMLSADQGVYRVLAPGGTEAAILALSRNPNVAFAEPNYKVTIGATAQDTYYNNGLLWGVESSDVPTQYGPTGTTNQYGSGAEEAWGLGYTGSTGVVVAVLDEGIQITHPDLQANIWTNIKEIPGNGKDDDNNGKIDDVNGWDFYHNDNTVYDVGEDAHGTHVAGTIGAVGNNNIGVAGVNWNVTIIPAKFLGPNGGYISDAANALYYLTDLKKAQGINLVAVNNSWAGGSYSATMQSAINRAAKNGILFVAAAGNSSANNDNTANYPSNYSSLKASPTESAASYESVIAVASIKSSGALSTWSSYGATTVDLGAPGEGIWSTIPTNSYQSYDGTSMATPHVTGALALYASYNKTATAAGLRSAILANVKPTTSLSGKTVTGGRLSLEGMFNNAPPTNATYDPAVFSVSTVSSIPRNQKANVTVVVRNLGNTAVQASVSLSAKAGTPGAPTAVFVPAGGSVSTIIGWTAPKTIGSYTLTATTTIVGTLVDANLSNNIGSVVIKVT